VVGLKGSLSLIRDVLRSQMNPGALKQGKREQPKVSPEEGQVGY